MQLFDARDDVAHLARFERLTGLVGRGEYTQVVGVVDRVGGHHFEALALAQAAVNHANEHDNAHIGVEPAIHDHGAQGRIRVAFGWRDLSHHGFEDFFDAHAGFGRAWNGVGGIDADDVFNFSFGVLGVCLRQIHLVEHRHHFHTEVQRGVAIGDSLCLNPLAGIHHQERALASRQ